MKVSSKERTELLAFITDLSLDVPVKEVAKLAVYSSILEKHQNHTTDIKIVNKGLKAFINEVRANEA